MSAVMPAGHSHEETPLAAKLRRRMAQQGPMSVAEYMEACLADPDHGYYLTRDPLGACGDFITAPEISQIFGELIGLWCAEAWRLIGTPSTFHLAEAGPGRGTLMADALRAARLVPEFLDALQLHLIETSPVLREEQKRRLGSFAPRWHERIDALPPGPLILIGNEFLDCLPVRQFQLRDGAWYERCVTATHDGFAFTLASTPLDDVSLIPEPVRRQARPGDLAEVRPALKSLLADLARRAEAAPLIALFIDYGHLRSAPGESLQAVGRHAFADPLAQPGNLDLTAHVDFAALAEEAREVGLCTHGPLSQFAFLMALGLAQRCSQLLKTAGAHQREEISTAAARLADPQGMGGLFKVIAVTGRDVPPLPAITAGAAERGTG
ncbi:MAG: SAM-dependent methyltransferase [Methyloligellaceae bacterium]